MIKWFRFPFMVAGFTDHFVATVTGLALLENEYQGGGDGDDMSATTVTSSGSGHHL